MNPLVMGVLSGGVAGLGSAPQVTAKPSQQKQADVFGDMLDAGLYNGQRSTWQADRIEQLEARIADLEARIWDE